MCYPCKKNTGRMRSTVYSIFQYGNIQYDTELAHPISFANPLFDLVDPPDNSDFFFMDPPEEIMIDLTNSPPPVWSSIEELAEANAAATNALQLPPLTNALPMQTLLATTAEVMDVTYNTPSLTNPNQTAPSEEALPPLIPSAIAPFSDPLISHSAPSTSWMVPEPMAMFPSVQGQPWTMINPSLFTSIVNADEPTSVIPSPDSGPLNQSNELPDDLWSAVLPAIPPPDNSTPSQDFSLAASSAATVPSVVPSASNQGNEQVTPNTASVPSASNQPIVSTGLTVISHVASPVSEVAADIQQIISSHMAGTSYQVSSLAESNTLPEASSPSTNNVASDSYLNIDSFEPEVTSSTASLLHPNLDGDSPVYNVIHIGVSSQVTNSLTPTQLTEFMQQLGTHIGGLSNGNMPYVTGLSGEALATFTANYNAAQQKARAPAKESTSSPFTHFPPCADPQPLLPPIEQLFPHSVSSAPPISHWDLERSSLPTPEDPPCGEEKMEEGEEEEMEDDGEDLGGIHPNPGFF